MLLPKRLIKLIVCLNFADLVPNQLGNGICTSITATGGIIQSPNFPSNFGADRSLSYTIQAPPNKRISIIFDIIVMEFFNDIISVSLKRYCVLSSLWF